MTQEEKDEYIKYAKLLIPKLQAELENAKQDAAQSDVDSIRALHERNELRVENETLVKRLADIAAVNVALEFRVIDLEKDLSRSEAFVLSAAADYETAKAEYELEIAELRRENDHKFAAMCRLRADIEKYRDYVRGLQAGTQFGV